MSWRAQALLVASIVHLLCAVHASNHLPPEPPARPTPLDLVDVPLGVTILQLVGAEFQDAFYQSALNRASANLEVVVRHSVQNPSTGYLVFQERFVDPLNGAMVGVSLDRLLIPLGPGISPMDAYAEWLRAPQVRLPSRLPPGSRNESRYWWIRVEDDGSFDVSHVINREQFEARGRALFIRRETEKNNPFAESINAVTRANFWSQVVDERLALLRDESRQQRVRDSMAAMESIQSDLNQNYAAYLSAEEQYLSHLARQSMYQSIASILSIVEAGYSAGHKLVELGNAEASNGVDLVFLDDYVPFRDDLEDYKQHVRGLGQGALDGFNRVNSLIDDINREQAEITNVFSEERVTTPAMIPLPRIERRIPIQPPSLQLP